MDSFEKLAHLLIIKSEKEVMESKLSVRGPLHSEKEWFNNQDQRLEDKTSSCFTSTELELFKTEQWIYNNARVSTKDLIFSW